MNPDTFKTLPEKLSEIIGLYTKEILAELFPELAGDEELIAYFIKLYKLVNRYSKHSFPLSCDILPSGDIDIYSYNYGLNTMEIQSLRKLDDNDDEGSYESPTILEYTDPSQENLVRRAEFMQAVYSYL